MSTERVTPAAVGRGEREEIIQRATMTSRQLRTRAAGLLEGEEVHASAGDFANAADRIDTLLSLLAALPPDAGGEDGEPMVNLTYATGDSPVNLLDAAADIIEREMYRMDVDNFTTQVEYRNYKRVRDGLRTARRSATERSGGGN